MLVRNVNSPAHATPLHFTINLRNIFPSKSKKSCSINHFRPFSPSKVVDNPQQKKYRDSNQLARQQVINLKPLTAAVNNASGSGIHQYETKKIFCRMSQNLSYNNIRTTFSPPPYARKDRQLHKTKDNIHSNTTSTEHTLLELKKPIKTRKDEKKCKEAPSFIKNKMNYNQVVLEDFKIIKMLLEEDEYKQFVAQHKKTSALFIIKSFKKSALFQEKQNFEQFRFYIKTLQINHNLIVKCFGYFYDFDHIYVIEQFLAGETLNQLMSQRHEGLNEQQVGSKVCEILTAITYLHSINFCYGSINQSNIINTLNICKLKRPQMISQKKGILFDIWCLGKLTFELVTACKLIDQKLLQNCNRIEDIFKSSQIVLALQYGFKRFESGNFSRDLIKFLIATLWQTQNKSLTLEQLWQHQFVKIYKQQDVWSCQGQK